MARSVGYVYILHFHTPLASGKKQSRHYVGWSRQWYWRIQQHRAGRGARIMEVCADRGIGFSVACVCSVISAGGVAYAGRAAERQIKRGHNYKRYCPLCGGHGAVDYRLQLQAAEHTAGGAMQQRSVFDQYRTYVGRLAHRHYLDPAEIESRKRTKLLCAARWIIWLALAHDGYKQADIARAAGVDHATVQHGLARAAANQVLTQRAETLHLALVPEALSARELGVADHFVGGLLAYAKWLCGAGPMTAPAMSAIYALASHPTLRERFTAACSGYVVAEQLWRLRLHARQLNALWREQPSA